jgi:hypothetical protein
MEVLRVLQFYEQLVQRHSTTTHHHAILRSGNHPENLKLWKPLCNIVRFCNERKIDPLHFVQAQFDEWIKPNPVAPEYPTSHYVGLNVGSVARYRAWHRRVRALREAHRPEIVRQYAEAVLKNIMVSRADLKTVTDVLRDPFLVRLLPVSYVRELPEFRQVAPDLMKDPAASFVLSEYFN